MLQTIREKTQGWIAGVIISIICLTFALWGIHSYFTGNRVSTTVAEVNGQEISKQALNLAFERLRRQNQQQYAAKQTTLSNSILRREALEGLIELEVLKQASLSQGFLISDEQVDAYLQSMPDFQVNGEFSLERFQQAMASSLLSTGEFLQLIKTTMLVNQPRLGITLTAFATPEEIHSLMLLVDQARDIEYILIPEKHISQENLVISQDDVRQYYNDHKKSYMSPEQVRVKYVELSVKDLAEKIKPTDTMLEKYYQQNLHVYTKPKSWRLTEIRVPISNPEDKMSVAAANAEIADIQADLDKGADFNALAKQHQSDKSYVGEHMVTINMLPVELQADVSGLMNKGDRTRPIKMKDAFVILMANDIKEANTDTFTTVKARVKEDYIRQHAQEKYAELRERLADLAYEQPDSLDNVSGQLGLAVKTSSLFSRDKGGDDFSKMNKVRQVAFTSDILELKNNSEVLQLSPDVSVVIRVDKHEPSSLQPLSAVDKSIVKKLKQERLDAQLKMIADTLLSKINNGVSIPEVAKNNKLQLKEMGYLSRYSIKVNSAILDEAFKLPNPAQNNLKQTASITKTPEGYAVVILKHVKDGDASDNEKVKLFAEQAQNSEGALEYELYKSSQMNKAKVKYKNV